MDVGTVLSVAQTLFATLQRSELKELCALSGYKSQVEDLQGTVSTVRAVLRDAETKQELSHEAQLWIQELKEAVYDTDDLLDKFVTVVQQKQLMKGAKATKQVRTFFSLYNPFGIAYNMSQGVQKIRKKLDAIAHNHAQFGFNIDPQPVRQRREETCSYVYERNIIGREYDVEKIVGHLLDDSRKDVSFLTIVGIGGLGKTALAQLVYNDARVTNAFPLKIWTCVSDYNQEQLDIEKILYKILASKHEPCTKEMLQSQVRAKLTSNKYLLVLDDVWTENRNHWLKLEEFLLGGQRGSWILLTTRSHKTARIVGDSPITHELQGLSKEKSWCLFKKVAFGLEQSNPHEELVSIGQKIVEDCARVPLAIRVAGSLLFGQNKSSWECFQKIRLSNFRESQTDIMPILKLSYDQLESPLKSCFTYCALFPKDYELNVFILKRLWMAQNYIVPLDDAQSMEDVAEEYFSILLRRCFFQDVECDHLGAIISCKIHDLMHDIAQQVAGKEICVQNFSLNDVQKKTRHLAYTSRGFAHLSFKETHLRSYLYVGPFFERPRMELSKSTLEALLSNWVCLRVLDLSDSGIKRLPNTIGKLLHLRYLDLQGNCDLEVLPKSIMKLYNLQTLRVGGCWDMIELPKEFIKLVNLRTLDIRLCGIKYLTCLGSLPHLKYLELESLAYLEYIIENVELKGSISSSTPDGRLKALGFISFPCLESLKLYNLPELKGWGNSRVEVGDNEIDTSSRSMTTLLFPRLKLFEVVKCPNLNCNLLLPNLEVLWFRFCFNNQSVQVNRFSKESEDERVEENSNINKIVSIPTTSSFYAIPKVRKVSTDNVAWLNKMPMESFQSLVELSIGWDMKLENLREAREVFRSCSSSLVSLSIEGCSSLRSVMSGGLEHLISLKTLKIGHCNINGSEDGIGTSLTLSRPSFLQSLRCLTLVKLPNLPDWVQCLLALETLEFYYFKDLETMPDWMPKLTSLKLLRLHHCSEGLTKRCQKFTGEDWHLIQHIPFIIVEDRRMVDDD